MPAAEFPPNLKRWSVLNNVLEGEKGPTCTYIGSRDLLFDVRQEISIKVNQIMIDMRAINPEMEDLYASKDPLLHYFALCEYCFWSATILKMEQRVVCPACTDPTVSLIPLGIDEQYRINLV